PRLPAMKSVVRAAPLVASAPTAAVLAVDAVAALAKTLRQQRLRPRLKENKHAATVTQKIPQRAKGPQYGPGYPRCTGIVWRVRFEGHGSWPPYRAPDRIRPSCDQPPHQTWRPYLDPYLPRQADFAEAC